MDFIDPKIERRNRLVLLIGYCFVAVAIAIATLLLLYQSTGFNIDSKGKVTQNGLLFVSSQPNGSAISFNGKLYKSTTNTRAVIPADTYTLKISAAGYRDWQRQVVVNGGDVQHFDYPFLFPAKLTTKSLGELTAKPSLATQSPDKRWILLDSPDNSGVLKQFDMKNPALPVVTDITLPTDSFTPGDGAQTWSMVEWSTDNRHVLLLHTYVSGGTVAHEYVVVNRDSPADSTNLTKSLSLATDDTVSLYDTKVDQYYVFNQADKTLRRVKATDGSQVVKLDGILAYKSYGSDQLLYVSAVPPNGKTISGQVSAVLQDGQKTTTLRTLPASASSYVLNMAQYSGDWYVAVGAASDNGVYLYKNPQSAPLNGSSLYPSPLRKLPVSNPNYLSFSSNTQFLLAESGQEFVVYDFENIIQYHYTATQKLDQPQSHATWMDGNRLTYVSGGKLQVFDYDYRNKQSLQAADGTYVPFFSANYADVYTVRAANESQKPALTSTALTTAQQ